MSDSSWTRSPYLWAALAGLVLIPAMRPLLRHEPPPPPVQFRLPGYSLVDSRGQSFGSAELEGRVYLAAFIFTRCTSICPVLTRAMEGLDRRYREQGIDDVHLVSITVDPEFDTPEILRDYGAAHGIEPRRWSLLTGPPEQVRSLVVEGFRLPLGEIEREEDPEPALMDIAHSAKIVLVDGQGGVRGYYDTDAQGLDEVFHRSLHVLKEER